MGMCKSMSEGVVRTTENPVKRCFTGGGGDTYSVVGRLWFVLLELAYRFECKVCQLTRFFGFKCIMEFGSCEDLFTQHLYSQTDCFSMTTQE
jgi:hypothetical protein